MISFPLVEPALKINFFVTMWDTPDSNTGGAGSALATVGTALLNTAMPFLSGGFSEVDGLDAVSQLEVYHEGGHNTEEHQFFKRASYTKITLKRGVTFNSDLWDWHHQFITGKRKTRKSGSIILLDQRKLFDVPNITAPFEHFPVAAWTFHNAVPEKLIAPKLNALQGEGDVAIAIETIEIHPEKTERLSLSLIPGVADLNSAVSGLIGLGGSAAAAGAVAGISSLI